MTTLSTFSKPRSIAVIGASKTKGKIGNIILRNIISSNYPGSIYPVNPRVTEIEGCPAFSSVEKIPKKIDLAVITVPAPAVLSIVETCGQAGIKNVVIISAGFKEAGTEGLAREQKLIELAKKYGMRLLGPNCVGIMDTHTPLNASFAAGFPRRGDIAFISQSGAMLVAILDWSFHTELGFSKFISLGNKADLNEADFIQDAADDKDTRVILGYIEDVTNGAAFLKTAQKASQKKPVIILKSGSSDAGARAASSHTGALAGSNLAYETAFRQSGVIWAHSMGELFDLAAAFSNQPLPDGNNVAVITNAGGPGIIATDSIDANGLSIARFHKETLDALAEALPREANIYNPVDILGDAHCDRYKLAMEKAIKDPGVNAMLVLLCPTATSEPLEIAQAIDEVHQSQPEKPIFAVFMGGPTLKPGVDFLAKAGIPCFVFPEVAVSALAGMAKYRNMQKQKPSKALPSINNINKEEVRHIFQAVREDRRVVLLGNEGAGVTKAYGISSANTKLATKAEEAVAAAEELGYPVVLKVASPKIIHKTDIGGVKMGLHTAGEVMANFWAIMSNVQRSLPNVVPYGIEVQEMAPKGSEVIIGMSRDVHFGPLIAFGLGGIYVNLLKDVSFRLASMSTPEEISEMIKETKAYTLLRGYRGQKPADIAALVDIISRVARLVLDFPEITELDINPVFVYTSGAKALDVKITIS